MHFSAIPLLFAALPFASAATTTSSSTSSTTSTSPSDATHTVLVGSSPLSFTPSSLEADPGTKVEFHFFPKTHSVAQAAFAKPCVPLNSTSFYSGGFSTASGENATTFTIDVTDTTPIWYYCAYPGHCGQGMVGAINPTVNKTLDAFKAAASGLTSTAPLTVQGGVVGKQGTGTSTSSSSTSSPTSSASATATGAGMETRGSIKWMGVGAAFLAAWGVGALMA